MGAAKKAAPWATLDHPRPQRGRITGEAVRPHRVSPIRVNTVIYSRGRPSMVAMPPTNSAATVARANRPSVSQRFRQPLSLAPPSIS